MLQGQTSGTATDFEGTYRLEGVPAGVHNVVVSFLGYTSETVYEIETTPARPAVVNVALSEAAIAVDAAEVVAESRATVEEAPLSVRSIGTNEIKRNPGDPTGFSQTPMYTNIPTCGKVAGQRPSEAIPVGPQLTRATTDGALDHIT